MCLELYSGIVMYWCLVFVGLCLLDLLGFECLVLCGFGVGLCGDGLDILWIVVLCLVCF